MPLPLGEYREISKEGLRALLAKKIERDRVRERERERESEREREREKVREKMERR